MKDINLTYNEKYNKDFYVMIEKDKFKNKIFHFILYTNDRIEQKQLYVNMDKENKKLEILYPGNIKKITINNISRRFFENEVDYILITHISKNYNKTPQTIKGILI